MASSPEELFATDTFSILLVARYITAPYQVTNLLCNLNGVVVQYAYSAVNVGTIQVFVGNVLWSTTFTIPNTLATGAVVNNADVTLAFNNYVDSLGEWQLIEIHKTTVDPPTLIVNGTVYTMTGTSGPFTPTTAIQVGNISDPYVLAFLAAYNVNIYGIAGYVDLVEALSKRFGI